MDDDASIEIHTRIWIGIQHVLVCSYRVLLHAKALDGGAEDQQLRDVAVAVCIYVCWGLRVEADKIRIFCHAGS